MTDSTDYPSPSLWQSPLCWTGWPPQAVENYSREFPPACTLVRGELLVTLTETIGPGITRESQRALPALIRLEAGQPISVDARTPEGSIWTLVSAKKGRKKVWQWQTSNADLAASLPFARAVLQSLLPSEATRKFICLMIDESGSTQNLAATRDPDPND